MNIIAQASGMDAAALFAAQGFLARVPLYTAAQSKLVLNHLRSPTLHAPFVWFKGYAPCDRLVYDIATRPALLDILKQILGPDLVLWGASLIERDPDQMHHWHTDIESSDPSGGFASVWVGLENTSVDSSLQLIAGSHRFGRPIQKVLQERGISRLKTSPALVADWAKEIDPRAQLVQPAICDGEAIVFDGRLWHGSRNSSDRKRAALLLQYVRSDTPVFIPDYGDLTWPFHFTAKRPPSVLVGGSGNAGNHDLLVPPSACPPDNREPVTTFIDHGTVYAEDAAARWHAYGFFHGPTPNAEAMESHLSVLSAGHSPHPPHAHVEEELLLVLDGIADIHITDDDKSEGRVEQLRPGSFVYHPAYQHHTIRNRSDAPVTYLMFKWQSCPLEVEAPLQTLVCHSGRPGGPATADPMWMRVLFESPTSYLSKLHAHETVLQPGGGYAAHADEHDVAIVVRSGTIRTADRDIGPKGILYFSAGALHGMHNPGPAPAHYLVFEFHSPGHHDRPQIGRNADQRDGWKPAKNWLSDCTARLRGFLKKRKRSIVKRLKRRT